MELVGSCQPEADHTMSDVLIRPSEVDISEPDPSPEPRFSSVRDKVSIRRVAIVLFALVVGGWLFIADTAADN
ncbi:MAG: hypothetical protein ACJASK_001871, partial [Ilumatobacter sp.]